MTFDAPDGEAKTTVVGLRDASLEGPAPAHRERQPIDRRESSGAPAPAPVRAAEAPSRRLGLRPLLMIGGVAAAAIGAGWFWITGGGAVSSDDAYIEAAKLMVSTDVSGLVQSVDVTEGEKVARGQVLFQVDPRQYEIALAGAKANLAQIQRAIASAMEDYKRLTSDIGAQTAQIELDQTNFQRAAQLYRANAGSKATYDQALYTLQAAQQARASLADQAQEALIKLGGRVDLPIDQQPQYLQAKSQVDEAQRELDHTTIRAPFAGRVTGVDSLQPGTFLVSQTAALTNTGAIGLVSDANVWATANMKETDLTYVKVGDPATVTVDAYPGRVWRGRVATIYPATGSQFSILPAENSSGNWVKVVQRIPLRVALDPEQGAPTLRAGMSATVVVDTGHQRHWSDLWSGWTAQAAAKPSPEP